jgi:DHA1 family bicyclomycin/chloramphenicol resistance-like MFS transporter
MALGRLVKKRGGGDNGLTSAQAGSVHEHRTGFILFGNVNALAMEPLGHIAGVGAAVVDSLSPFLATPLGMAIGQAFNGTVMPLVAGFSLLGPSALALMRWAEQTRTPSPQDLQPVA